MPLVREVALPADPMMIARSLRDRPGLSVLASSVCGASRPDDARSSFVACDPTAVSDVLVPEIGALTFGWAGLPAAPRWIGMVPYERFRGLERSHWTRADTRESPMISHAKWLHYAAVIRVDHPSGKVVIEADDEAAASHLLALASRGPRDSQPFTLIRDADLDDGHAARVRRVLELIAAGDVYQVNLARRLAFAIQGDALDLFFAMRHRAPSPWCLFFDMGSVQVACTSPELALSVVGKTMRSTPIKGTRPRGEDWTADRAMVDDLDRDPKERAELVMAIDLHRNDLGRVAEISTVRVQGLPRIVSGATVHSRVAEVVATRADGVSLSDIAQTFLPAGSVTGAPKVRAMEIIADLEPHRRGLYTGAVGYVGRDGSLVLAMAIRTATIRQGRAHYFTGGGIVSDSDPEREVEETNWKARQMEFSSL